MKKPIWNCITGERIYSVSNKTEFEFSHIVIDVSIYFLTTFSESKNSIGFIISQLGNIKMSMTGQNTRSLSYNHNKD